MQVQPIQLYTMPKNLKLRECDPQSGNCEGVNEINGTNTRSIYSKGMANIAFGNVAKARSYFEKEIAEQPDVLNKLVRRFFSKPDTVNMDLNITQKAMQEIKRIHIFASGSSKNAAEMAQGFIEKMTNIPVIIESSSEAMYNIRPQNDTEDLAIFVSQSGETADTYSALKISNLLGLNTIAVTNNPKSKIAKNSGSDIFLNAGEEKAVAATKTVTSSIFSLMALGMKLGEIRGSISPSVINKYGSKFGLMSLAVQYMLKNTDGVKEAANVISEADNIYYYAKSNTIGSAKEGALKLTETTGKRVIADASGEALHGTFASIKPEDVVLQIADYKNGNIAKTNLEEIVRKRHVKNPIIMQGLNADRTFNSSDGIKPVYIEMPLIYEIEDDVAPILTTIRFQQITNEVTKKLGINPDNGGGFLTKFRGGISM